MSVRVSALTVVVVAAVAIVASVELGRIPAAAAAEKPSFKVPRTSWGDPDLQGVWDYRTITPLERRPEIGDREYYTDEEIAQLEGRAAKRLDEAPDTTVQTGLVHADYLTDPGRHVDESRRTSLIIDPKTGRMPPLTPEAQQRQEKAAAARTAGTAAAGAGGRVDSYLDRPLYERCITRGLPATILPTLYNNNIRIAQSPGYVAIVHEMIHEPRVVPLGGSFGHVRSYLGESRGHWEGDTLVIETRNFNGKAGFRGAGENLVLTERYTKVAPDKIDFRLTFEDRTQWTQPWTVAYFMRTGEGDMYEYACHEGNYGLRNILQEARDADRAAAAEPAKK
jgi:hypothetical protein